jgi:chromosome segregation ATPase
MEGDMKDIVLQRLEKRLKDKDDEIRALKYRIRDGQPEDLKEEMRVIQDKVDVLSDELHEMQITQSEIMKKVCALESALNTIAFSECDEEIEEIRDPDLQLDGVKEPEQLLMYDKYVAAKTDPMSLMKETEDAGADDNGKSGLRFFRLSKNNP